MSTITATTDAWITNSWTTPASIRDSVAAGNQREAINAVSFSIHDMTSSGWVKCGTAEITLTLLDDDIVLANKVETMRAELQSVRESANIKIRNLEDAISSLLALPNLSKEEPK